MPPSLRRRVALAAGLGLGAAGCADQGAPVPTALDVPTHRLVLTTPGQPVALGVRARAGGAVLDAGALRYAALDTAVARVDADGRVRAVSAGRTVVVVTAGPLADTVVVEAAFAKPVWHFSVLGAISNVTLGGMSADAAAREFQRHLDSVNTRFNAPGVFAGYVVFVPAGLRVYTRSPAEELAEAPGDADFKVVYHSDYSIHFADYDNRYRVVEIGANPGDAFTDAPIAGQRRVVTLTHEFGHARGALDLYGEDVFGAENNVDSTSFSMPPSIMHGDQSTVWDPLTVYLINANAGRTGAGFDVTFAALDTLVPSWRVAVTDARGSPVAGAAVTIYGRNAVPNPRTQGYLVPLSATPCTTDATGACAVPWEYLNKAYLVAASNGSRRASVWVSALDLAAFALAHPGVPYPCTIALPH